MSTGSTDTTTTNEESTTSDSSSGLGIYSKDIDSDPDFLSYHVMIDQWRLQDEKSSYEPTSQLWKFKKILKHRKRGPSAEVLVDWTI